MRGQRPMSEHSLKGMRVPPGYTADAYLTALDEVTAKDRRFFERYPKRYARARFAEPVERAESGSEIIVVRKLNDTLRARYGFGRANDEFFNLPQEMLIDLVERCYPEIPTRCSAFLEPSNDDNAPGDSR